MIWLRPVAGVTKCLEHKKCANLARSGSSGQPLHHVAPEQLNLRRISVRMRKKSTRNLELGEI